MWQGLTRGGHVLTVNSDDTDLTAIAFLVRKNGLPQLTRQVSLVIVSLFLCFFSVTTPSAFP